MRSLGSESSGFVVVSSWTTAYRRSPTICSACFARSVTPRSLVARIILISIREEISPTGSAPMAGKTSRSRRDQT